MSPSPQDNNNEVTFSNDVEEAAPVTATDNPTSRRSSVDTRAKRASNNLTVSQAAWDIDGDGQLDETELALKKMDDADGTADGGLSKEQMYQLMNTNLKMQGELLKVKKVVFALVGFTVLLALANVGVSFAAAYLAKDTSSSGGKLVDSKSGDTLATDSTTAIFTEDPDLTERLRRHRRRLCETSQVGNGGNAVSNASCNISDLSALTVAEGEALVQACESGGSATIRKMFNGGHVDHPICPVVADDTATYTGKGQDAKGVIINKSAGGSVSVLPDNAAAVTLYVAEGVKSAAGVMCDHASDCADGLTCYTGNQLPGSSGTCGCASHASCGSGEVCASSHCMLADVGPQCILQSVLDQGCVDFNGGTGNWECMITAPTSHYCQEIVEEPVQDPKKL